MRIVITGANGLLGWHAHTRLHAANCAARFKGQNPPYDIVAVNHVSFQDDTKLYTALAEADAVLHFAGINRAPDDEIESGNPDIAKRLVQYCEIAGIEPQIVYANSIHSSSDTVYGNSKRRAGEVIEAAMPRYTNLVLPHIFGEGARPFYNNVTATLIAKLLAGDAPEVNPHGKVQLLYAGAAVQAAIKAIEESHTGKIQPVFQTMSVRRLLSKLAEFHQLALSDVYPNLSDPFDLSLYNTYRAATYPDGWPRPLALKTDFRGTLYEAVKGGGGGQCFLSVTEPGMTRGDHFHLKKVERFLVVQGDAVIRIRKVISDVVWEYRVSGRSPAIVDMPTLHTHSIENVGEGPLLTLFWTHEIFDPENPDTFSDKVK